MTEIAKEFDLENFESMETDVLNEIAKDTAVNDALIVDSLGPVTIEENMDEDKNDSDLVL